MEILKFTVATALKIPTNFNNVLPLLASTRHLHMPCKTTTKKADTWSGSKLPTVQKQLSENLKLIHAEGKDSNSNKPLVVVLEWLLAKNKHVHKFADIYLNHGFEVLAVKLKPWQLIWPVKGSQLIAEDLLKLLYQGYCNRPIVVHGLSVGGYLWGEVQVKMSRDLEKYQPLINNISGMIWDSVVDINETAVGVPAAIFPNNAMLRNACSKYILYHMKKFDKEATQHWRKARELFYCPVVKCPALLLYSKTDPIGNPTSYKNVRMSYESMGIQIYEKCWDKSPHVAHYVFHREEYVAQVEMFLESVGLLTSMEKRRAAAI